MIKLLLPGGWDFGEPQSVLVKCAARGLIGADRKALEKRAGERFVAELPEFRRAKDEEIVHMIAMGAEEAYSSNRNGDGFREPHLKNSHDTFRKYAKPFRDHRNHSTDPHYGRVIQSSYHEPMRRVELLVGYNGGPESITQNGGRLADLELEKLASSTDLPVSMSCRVSHDICSGCGNKARSRAEYCDHNSNCKYGGLKAHIAETFEDGHTLHADNPDPKFFDISYVPKPADRIAYALGTLYKAASADWTPYARYHCSGAGLAEDLDLRLPETLWPDLGRDCSGRLKLAAELAQAERRIGDERSWALAWHPSLRSSLTPLPGLPPEQLFGALLAEKVALDLREFATVLTGDSKQAAAALPEVARHLPGIYGRLEGTEALGRVPLAGLYECDFVSPAARKWAAKLAAVRRLDQVSAAARVRSAVFHGATEPACTKAAAVIDRNEQCGAARLAQAYAGYQLALLDQYPRNHEFPFAATLLTAATVLPWT